MDCAGVAGVLVAYHLGSIADEERDEVEAHLLSCPTCIRTYLALKRAADRAAGAAVERPRPEVRERLRAEVMRSFAPKNKVATLGRRIPLYQGVALAAIAAAVALVAPSFLQWAGRNSGHNEPSSAIDTNRTRAESLHIY
jgi:anti-sigma factor RsiW